MLTGADSTPTMSGPDDYTYASAHLPGTQDLVLVSLCIRVVIDATLAAFLNHKPPGRPCWNSPKDHLQGHLFAVLSRSHREQAQWAQGSILVMVLVRFTPGSAGESSGFAAGCHFLLHHQ